NLSLSRDSTGSANAVQGLSHSTRPGVLNNEQVANTAWFEAAHNGNLYFDVAYFSVNQESGYQQQYLHLHPFLQNQFAQE
ncbi:MAG: hypothetical protein ABI638_00745, partial [Ignavibacteriota bacterium]